MASPLMFSTRLNLVGLDAGAPRRPPPDGTEPLLPTQLTCFAAQGLTGPVPQPAGGGSASSSSTSYWLARRSRPSLLAGQHVDQLDLDPRAVGPGQGGLQITLGRLAAPVLTGQRRAAGHMQDDVVGEDPKPVPQSPRCTASR